jgi:osmotically-inducible protein OsmY
MEQSTTRSERDIRKDILDHLYWDSRFSAVNIDVEVLEGKVKLSGSVPTAEAVQFAEAVARAIPGVEAIENLLTVKMNDSIAIPSDVEVETNVRDSLRWHSDVDLSKVKVTVNAGFAILEGHVKSYYQKFRAHELASDVIGVMKVDNQLAIVTTGFEIDEEIAGKVVHALQERLGTDAGSLTAMVRNEIVTLTGTVPDEIAFAAAENAVRHIEGVADVHNLVVVGCH